jgi:tetratricopeptide (TPR) repeat protein
VNAMLSQAFFLSGRLGEALNAGEVALVAIAEQGGFHNKVTLDLNPNQILGFDVEHWIKCLRTRILVRLGRFREADKRLAEVFQAEPERVAAVVQFIPHFAMVEMAWGQGRPELARPHAAKIAELAELSGTPYLRVAAIASDGLAKASGGDFEAGAHQLREAVDFARSARAGLEFEARMLADLSEALFRAGHLDQALRAADEAVLVARRRTDRIAELHATLLRALSIAASDDASPSHDELDGLVNHAQNLLSVSGAAFFQPKLVQLRSHLDRRG